MEKRKWLWKRKPSDKSSGETESSDELETSKESPDHDKQSPEVTSKPASTDDEVKENLRCLTAKLSAALVNVSAKEDLVKQHAKVAEEAVAGWEKAEKEVAALKQQLEAAVQQNVTLEVRVSHLDGALKECVRQLRNAKDEQEQRIQEAIVEKTMEWESLEKQLAELQLKAEVSEAECHKSADHDVLQKLERLEKENAALKHELLSRTKELEIRTIERDLSTQTAETASKQQLESIKKFTRLEAEYRRLQAQTRKLSVANDKKSFAASSDSQSESGEQLNIIDTDCWASALIAELDQFKNGKSSSKNLAAVPVEIEMMDDFLEMERLASLSESKNVAPEATIFTSSSVENPLMTELQTMAQRVSELEQKLETIEAEKTKLGSALNDTEDALKASQIQLKEAEIKLEELQKELAEANESKELLEFQLFGMEVEARAITANIDTLKTEVERERSLSADMAQKCQDLENEIRRKAEKVDLPQPASSTEELKVKQEDLAVAADKLAECQKTIASLGRQLQSLATLEDFLTDTVNLQGFSAAGVDPWKMHLDESFNQKLDSDPLEIPDQNSSHSMNGNYEESPASSSSSSTSSANHVSNPRGRNGFGKLFSRSKSRTQL
ncbi:PREDICTED: filament-like plant protein [Ipomoea nil]|uniref:filament-like plant protein n=1 Tax=Ipomoea nil TaxID=35883 RepID=UPI000901AED5|nr:PREDICTED: filament-like plant protein [Ipomoea nil]